MRRITNIIGLLALLVVGGAAAWKWMPHRLSYDECSDVYRHFADMQLRGVQVTYVRDKVVNDTLRLPVTLLKAETDEGWKAIDDIFGCSRQIDEILNEPDIPDSVKREFLEMPFTFYTYRANRETPEVKAESGDFRPGDLFVYVFLNLRCITIYEPADARNEREVVNGYAIESQRSF